MKKKISLVLAVCMSMGMLSNSVMAGSIALPADSAVIVDKNLKMYATGSIFGSVYSANGDMLFDQGIKYIDGDVVYNDDNKFVIRKYDEPKIKGEIKAVEETSFDYKVSDVDIDTGDIGIFDGRDYDVQANVTAASWTGGGLTIDKDTYFKDSFTVFEPVVIDTSKGDVYVKIDNLNMQNSDEMMNNGIIKVVGDGKAYIMVNSIWGGNARLYVNAEVDYNGNGRKVTAGDSDKVDLYINANGKTAGIDTQSVVCADIYMVNESTANEWSGVGIQGEIYGDIYVSADYVSVTADGSTSVKGDIYVLDAEKVSVSNDVTGNIVTDAQSLVMTGGDAKVVGVVYAPEADVQIFATREHNKDDADVIGQVVGESLEMTGCGKIVYDKGIVDGFGVTDAEPTETPEVTAEPTSEPTEAPEVTAEPTSEPTEAPEVTAEPTSEPTETPEVTAEPTEEPNEVVDNEKKFDLIPDNDIPKGPQKKLKSDSAYLYGYTDNWVGADRSITREEVCALINRLLVQNDARDDYEKPEEQSYADVSGSHWSYSALEYMSYIEVYNTDDGSGVKRKISPETPMTRGEVAKVVAFSLRLPYEPGELDFDDVTADHKYYKYMKAMVDAGLWQGDNGMLRPDSEMTRAEFVTMFNRIIGRTEENGYIVTVEDCPFIYNDGDGDLFAPIGTLDENGDDIGHWAFYEITRAACSFTKKKVDPDKKMDRAWLDQQ